jgi:hypothetical protein
MYPRLKHTKRRFSLIQKCSICFNKGLLAFRRITVASKRIEQGSSKLFLFRSHTFLGLYFFPSIAMVPQSISRSALNFFILGRRGSLIVLVLAATSQRHHTNGRCITYDVIFKEGNGLLGWDDKVGACDFNMCYRISSYILSRIILIRTPFVAFVININSSNPFLIDRPLSFSANLAHLLVGLLFSTAHREIDGAS